jgi:acyl-CoA thioester hydrolase
LNPVFSHQLEVRFRDCDAMGHVNNAVYLTYLEQTRFHHWRALRRSSGRPEHKSRGAAGIANEAIGSPASPGESMGEDVLGGVIVARAEIDYRRAAKFSDVLRIDLGVAAIGRTSFTYEYEILDQSGALIATAKTVIVRFDYATGRPVPISEQLKQALTRDVRAGSD